MPKEINYLAFFYSERVVTVWAGFEGRLFFLLIYCFPFVFVFYEGARGLCQRVPLVCISNIRSFHPLPTFILSQRHCLLSSGPRSLLRVPILNASTQPVQNPKQTANTGIGTTPPVPVTAVQVSDEPDVLYHMIEIEIRCGDPAVLQSYNQFITMAAGYLDLTLGLNEVAHKPHKKRWTVLKSTFGHKKHMVQYEVRTYHHKLSVLRITGSTADTFLEYIQRNLPEGVSMRVGRVRMEKVPDHLLTPPSPEDLEPTFLETSEEPKKGEQEM